VIDVEGKVAQKRTAGRNYIALRKASIEGYTLSGNPDSSSGGGSGEGECGGSGKRGRHHPLSQLSFQRTIQLL
jgi:hypothetical protein